jgi:serine/threonine protein kinase
MADTLADHPELRDSAGTTAETPIDGVDEAASISGQSRPDDLIGAIIGERYEILGRLDRGGMGIVYKARHTVLENFLAVKILLRAQDDEARRRFLLEAKLASKINHPNTVYISDFGVLEDGRSYLVMELLTGPTLARALDGGAMDPLRACQIAVQIARGLCAVHSTGIVHRDLKPENIFLVDQEGQDGSRDFVKIVDFGIAQYAGQTPTPMSLIDAMGSTAEVPLALAESRGDPGLAAATGAEAESVRFTIPGTLLGTPLYMSPEQAQGLVTDARSDQYALGCILYEMLTGQVPFSVTTVAELLEKHIKIRPPPPRQRLAGLQIADRLEALVMRLLEKHRDHRYASMREVEQVLSEEVDLLLLERGEKVTVSRRVAAQLQTAALAGRKWRALWIVALLAAAVSGSLWGWQWMEHRRVPPVETTLLRGELTRLKDNAVSTLIDLTRRTDPEVRLPAILALGQVREAWLEPSLEELLLSPDEETQAQAATALGRLGAGKALPLLRALGERSQAAHVQVAVAAARLQLGDVAAERQLQDALAQGSSELGYQAALVLCEKHNPKAREILAERALRWDLSRPMAVDLWARLAQCGDGAARDKLHAEMVSGEVLDVPLLAATKLAQLNDTEGLDFLHRLVERPEYALRAWKALAQAGAKVDPEQFRHVLGDPNQAVSAHVLAAQGLGVSGELVDTRLLGDELTQTSDGRLREALAIAILQLSRLEQPKAPAQPAPAH